jgi:peptide/nickel transport system substrate-binding protein
MDQLVVQFELQPFIWSDGTPVTADDSVYSFEVAADPLTPVPKLKIERTADYQATGDHTIEWTGVPGYMDRGYLTNIWPPLPRHAWGDKGAADLLLADEVNKRPLSYGPYVVSEWVTGKEITFVRNQNYYLISDGLPLIDTVALKFIIDREQALPLLLSGQCDVLTQDLLSLGDAPALSEAAEKGLIDAHFQPGTVFEHIDFGINSVKEYETERPDWFENPLVRQAFLMCTDRLAIMDDFLYGQSQLINAYVPDNHPLFPDDAVLWPYDVESANALLDEAGFLDFDEDGLRNDPRLGGEFRVELLVALGNSTGLQIANAFKKDLASCGVEVVVESVDSDIYYADGPESPLFGRRFDLAEFPWLISIEPNCALYLSSETPGPENNWNRTYNNQTGFNNSSFDQVCKSALDALPGTDEYEDFHREALRIWTEQLPIIPLFLRLKLAATSPEVSGFVLDPTQNSSLWNIANIDINEGNSGGQ